MSDKITFLYKKFLGVPNAFPTENYTSEAAGNARMRVFSKDIMLQEVPPYAPTDLVKDASFVSVNNNQGERWYSISKPYIVKYIQVQLDEILPGVSYRYSELNTDINILSNTIPFNFDPITNTYNIYLYDKNGRIVLSNDDQHGWIIDSDVGFLYFIGTIHTFLKVLSLITNFDSFFLKSIFLNLEFIAIS